MAYKMIQVGTGGFGANWCSEFLPPNIKDGLIEVVAAVDINPENLEYAKRHLNLTAGQCYTDIHKAFNENRADFCTVVVPPAFHEGVVDVALSHDMHILSEKPIADSLEASVRIAKNVKKAGIKMGVTMSHRFDADKTTLRNIIRSGQYGPVDYIYSRFTCDCRKYASWGKFRHEIADPLLVEGAVHHLDLLADMGGAKCDRIFAETWNPEWGEYKGDSQAFVVMHLENGVRALYEGAKTNAVGLNQWTNEYIRVECEKATIILGNRRLEVFEYDPESTYRAVKEGQGTEVPLLTRDKWANAWLIEKFVRWLDGGEKMETNVEDNLQSVALIFSAIESSHTGMPIKTQDFLNSCI